MIFVVQKVLGVWENLEILLFEHFVEHEKLIWVLHVPKVRSCGTVKLKNKISRRIKYFSPKFCCIYITICLYLEFIFSKKLFISLDIGDSIKKLPNFSSSLFQFFLRYPLFLKNGWNQIHLSTQRSGSFVNFWMPKLQAP